MKLDNILLYSSFLQLKGISRRKEEALWESGIDTLGALQYSRSSQQSLFSIVEDEITPYIEALVARKSDVFLKKLDSKDYYRVAYSFPEQILFLDIETTGLSSQYHYITMAGWMVNGEYHYWLQGLPTDDFLSAVNNASLLVTFNGILFDCKFLDHTFKTDIFSKKPNLDLMHLCRRYGLTGGQKLIEEIIGFSRPTTLETTTGKEAIALWYQFLFGDEDALNKLLLYNYYDIQGMAYILDWVFYNKIYGISFPKIKKMPSAFFTTLVSERIFYPSPRVHHQIREHIKSHISNFSREKLLPANSYRIIGIDLAGKTSSRTGVCLLKDDCGETLVLHEDADIVDYALSIKPDLISIDAPLSLPKGRTTVYDDDPYRDTAGILRHCERVLKRRGINSYPALIRSMQELTKRGILLASIFRSHGIPVIECFPGAAQDIIQLPRKRTDETLLKKGLSRFGVHGSFEHNKVSHDELDAVTAALVGQFFISGFYEAIGIPEENDMIIPQKKRIDNPYSLVIGICGPISAGKSEVAAYFQERGFEAGRYSKIIADSHENDQISTSRAFLQQEGWKTYTGKHQYLLNQKLEQAFNSKCIVIDGMRHCEDYTYWKERCFTKFILLYIETDFSVRKTRYVKRGNTTVSYEDAISHPVESHISALKDLADYTVFNNSNKESLWQQLDDILNQVGQI